MKGEFLKWGWVALSFSLALSVFAQVDGTAFEAQAGRNDSINISIPLVEEIDLSCPPPTKPEGAKCVLEDNVVLTETLLISSGTTLDCKWYSLTPSVDGRDAVRVRAAPGNPFSPSVPSTPNTAVLLAGDTSGVTVKNCVIENFDFGIVIANSKLPNAAKTAKDDNPNCEKSNCIIDNTLDNRYRGVEILAADDNEISGNTIHSSAGSSGGISITHDSDDNLIKGNTYVGPSAEPTAGPLFPGGLDAWKWVWVGGGVRVLGPVFSYNFTVGNRLFVGTHDSNAWAERNTIEGNDVEVPNQVGNAFVAESRSDRTTFRGNIVRQAADGFSLVGHAWGRRGVESRNVLVEGNTVYGPVEAGMLAANTVNPVFRANRIMGSTFAGMFLVAQKNVIVTGNVIKDNPVGLFLLTSDDGSGFRGYVWKNDIFGNGLQVEAYLDGPLELSVDGKGNYWGHKGHDACPGFFPSDTSNPDLIKDSFPYIGPVVDLDPKFPPEQCE